MAHENLMRPEPTLLPTDEDAPVARAFENNQQPDQVAAEHPSSSRAWAELAETAWRRQAIVESYAYARVGYHRGLDLLRRNGWRGAGPVPWAHEGNQGFLRCVHALGRAAAAIGEADEAERCQGFLDECDPAAKAAITG